MGFIEFLKKNKNDSKDKDINADKAFMKSIAISFFAIIICIVMLSASTFAWFTTTMESENTIGSSVYELDVEVKYTVTDGEREISPTTNGEGHPTYALVGGKVYNITVTPVTEGTNGNTGYIKLIHGADTLYSEQIDRGSSLSFSITVNEDTDVTIIERWGISSVAEEERDIHSGDNLTLPSSEDNN